MKPRKHAEMIKAWADGAEIEYRTHVSIEWKQVFKGWSWDSLYVEYRIKPQPKPDVVGRYRAEVNGFVRGAELWERENLILTFDGETGKLKSAEVL